MSSSLRLEHKMGLSYCGTVRWYGTGRCGFNLKNSCEIDPENRAFQRKDMRMIVNEKVGGLIRE